MLVPTHLIAAVGIGVIARRCATSVAADPLGTRSQPALAIALLVVGAALPDLIDKPLGMTGVTELFHSVGHAALVLPVAVVVARAGPRGAALAIGWGSHLGLDALHVVINGRPSDALFLGWPLVVPPSPPAIPPGAFVRYYLWSLSFYLEVVIWLVVGALSIWSLRRDSAQCETTPE